MVENKWKQNAFAWDLRRRFARGVIEDYHFNFKIYLCAQFAIKILTSNPVVKYLEL